MQGDVGPRRLDRASLTVGHIEEERRADDAPPEHIQAAAVERLSMVLRVAFVTEGGFFPLKELHLFADARSWSLLILPHASFQVRS